MQVHVEKKRKIEDQSQKTGEERLSIKQWGGYEKKKQNESKKAVAVQSAALLCSVSIQLSAIMASDVLNSVNHALISSLLRWSMSASSCLSKITRFRLTLTVRG